jgi:hypothetical protein
VRDLHLTTGATNALREDNSNTAELTRLTRRECPLDREVVLPILRVQLDAVWDTKGPCLSARHAPAFSASVLPLFCAWHARVLGYHVDGMLQGVRGKMDKAPMRCFQFDDQKNRTRRGPG